MTKKQTIFIIAGVILALLATTKAVGTWKDYQAYTAKNAVTQPADQVVQNSTYDGSVRQVEDWLDKNLGDPKSVERVEWSPVVKTEQGNYVVRYKFRAKNATGGMELQDKVFTLGSTGIVLAASDYKPD